MSPMLLQQIITCPDYIVFLDFDATAADSAGSDSAAAAADDDVGFVEKTEGSSASRELVHGHTVITA